MKKYCVAGPILILDSWPQPGDFRGGQEKGEAHLGNEKFCEDLGDYVCKESLQASLTPAQAWTWGNITMSGINNNGIA